MNFKRLSKLGIGLFLIGIGLMLLGFSLSGFDLSAYQNEKQDAWYRTVKFEIE